MNIAAATAAGTVYTYEDYRRLPEGSPYQLIGGKLVMTPAPSPYHQIVAANLGFLLMKHCRENGLGLVLFSPLKSIEVFVLREGRFHLDQREEKKGRVCSRVVGGFSVAVEDIFTGRLD